MHCHYDYSYYRLLHLYVAHEKNASTRMRHTVAHAVQRRDNSHGNGLINLKFCSISITNVFRNIFFLHRTHSNIIQFFLIKPIILLSTYKMELSESITYILYVHRIKGDDMSPAIPRQYYPAGIRTKKRDSATY